MSYESQPTEPVLTEDIAYRDGDTPLTGVLVRHPSPVASHPGAAQAGVVGLGVLLVHGGAGLDGHARTQAARYARLGYTVFCCDMFGDDVAGDRKRVIATLVGLRDDPDRLARRGAAGLAVLRARPEVTGPIAAIGYCFGGLATLTFARAGLDLAGVVSIHGSLATPRPAAAGGIRAAVLACHGALDPHVTPSDVAAFQEEMTAAGADWQLHVYGGAEHGFTHAHAVPGAAPGVSFHARADARSYDATCVFLAEVGRSAS